MSPAFVSSTRASFLNSDFELGEGLASSFVWIDDSRTELPTNGFCVKFSLAMARHYRPLSGQDGASARTGASSAQTPFKFLLLRSLALSFRPRFRIHPSNLHFKTTLDLMLKSVCFVQHFRLCRRLLSTHIIIVAPNLPCAEFNVKLLFELTTHQARSSPRADPRVSPPTTS